WKGRGMRGGGRGGAPAHSSRTRKARGTIRRRSSSSPHIGPPMTPHGSTSCSASVRRAGERARSKRRAPPCARRPRQRVGSAAPQRSPPRGLADAERLARAALAYGGHGFVFGLYDAYEVALLEEALAGLSGADSTLR